MDGSNLLNYLKKLAAVSHGGPMLINNNGYWLFGGKPEYQWVFMFPEKSSSTVEGIYQELWKKLVKNSLGLIKTSQGQFIYKNLNKKIPD